MKKFITIATTVSLPVLAFVAVAKNLPVTKDEQAKMTPAAVMEDLMAGNKRYTEGQLSDPNVKASIAAATSGQYPKAFILSCIDSRVPVESVFDQGLGDIFVGRVAGNIENVDQLGSMEYAAAVAGVKVVMVLGHESCGAVKGACDHVKLGNITALLDNIQPAVKKVAAEHKDIEHNSKNKTFVDAVISENVRHTVADIRKKSPTLVELEKAGKLKIVGAVYSLETGKVSLVD